ncbi:MAG: hypoxanthine phosphoribosyltransferase [candidate division Zixibacteria bacterium]|nr:hypoxanthine phosphoribosyltransferase [candidate division Zixibacteria bacterium]
MDKIKIKKIISKSQIQKRVKKLSEEISRDYTKIDLILVGILKGSFVFLADLTRNLKIPHQVDFISVTSYGSSTCASGIVRILKDLSVNIQNRDVLIVEDIVDSGLTLNYIIKNFKTRQPKSLKVVTLLNKKKKRKVSIPLKYIGFDIPDEFVVGYGLDLNERFRNLPFIAKIQE